MSKAKSKAQPSIALIPGKTEGYRYWQARCGCGWIQTSGFRAFVRKEAVKHAQRHR